MTEDHSINIGTKGVQTDLTAEQLGANLDAHQSSLLKIDVLKEKLNHFQLTEEAFRNDDNKIKLHTGLPSYVVFMSILSLISPDLKSLCTLTKFQQLLLPLMKLHLDLPMIYLAHTFKVSTPTISRCFNDAIHVLHSRLVPKAIFWPEREFVAKHLPSCYIQTYPKCISIIDCFEIFIETPKNFLAKASTYSSYKSHNTCKYLLSITPQGFINFISDGWGGRVSDRHITENSYDYLKNLLPGDVVLADRGFTVEDVIALHGAKLEIPAFTRGKSQLSDSEVRKTRALASVRIHVERVIGHLRRKFPLLSSTIPITLLQSDDSDSCTIDKIVHVACALCNLCESVVPLY